ncbi:MAG TPA: spore coat U domain-containing protein [Aestuariivirgaceae bacterium]|jgi:spore coat protein U-like protein
MGGRIITGLLVCCFFCVSSASAGTDTDTFDVTLNIQAGCEVTSPNDLDFGTASFLDTAITAQVQFQIRCSSGTSGTISLNGGSGSSGTITTRTMENGANVASYSLYTASNLAFIWGDGTGGSSTVTHTGTGVQETLTIYGQVPNQATPPPGVYSDTVTITATF